MKTAEKKIVLDPLLDNNPITLQILGICSALAVTTSLAPALLMSAAVTAVLVLSNASVSLIRHHVPSSIRIIVMMTIIASLVIIVDQVLKAFAFDLAKRLTVFVGGFPIEVDGEVVGGIGASGGNGEQDIAACEAGIAAFEKYLAESR